MIRLSKGNGFITAYDYAISGFEVVNGCGFGCLYCYAKTIMKKSHEEFFQGGQNSNIDQKLWRTRLLESLDLLEGKSVYCATMVDPFQRVMAPYTKDLVNLMAHTNKGPSMLTIQTRSPLVLSAIGGLKKIKDKVRINFTIDTNDDDVRKAFSPMAPKLESRWKAIETLSEEGIPVCITVTPTLPFKRDRNEIKSWCDRANNLKTLTHVVVQEFHDGNFTSTPKEAVELLKSENYKWFKNGGYRHLKKYMIHDLRVPLMEERDGFGPEAPIKGRILQ